MTGIDIQDRLDRLARNFRWVWDRPTQEVFESVDGAAWQRGHDPLALLRSVPPDRWAQLDADPTFARRLAAAEAGLAGYLADPPGVPAVAYFCMEHGIAPELRIYAGGLGMLAGCIEKTASDLGVPMVAVGLRYASWFRQRLSGGWQSEEWQHTDPVAAGLEPVPEARVEVELAGERAAVAAWRARVGRLHLYLLDTDLPENPEHLRAITDRLYIGDTEHRLRQEIVLGIGGVRALRALGYRPAVFHANEGHAAFMGLERLHEYLTEGAPLDEAVAAVRAGTIFTTHTAVPAGFDVFERALVRRYFTAWCRDCRVPFEWLMELGRFPGQGPEAPFNMAVLCTRLAGQVNAVSKLHREITEERVLGPLWPGRAAPVRYITNGVHPRTWVPPRMAELFERYVGPGWDYADAAAWEGVWDIPDEELWAARQELRAELVGWVRGYLPRVLAEQGANGDLGWAGHVLDPDALTVVVARRAAEYKETDLLVSMPERLAALTGAPGRPVCLIVAGNAHPNDAGAKERIRHVVEYARAEHSRSRVVFLPAYDMQMAQRLLAGADVWLNHPRRGDEACGTSFMKAVFGGGRILTTADGGADELIVDEENGWLIGDRTYGATRQAIAAGAVKVLERAVVPQFYDRYPGGVPHAWVHGVKRSLASLAWQVSSVGMVRSYERMYRDAERTGRYLAGLARARSAGADGRLPPASLPTAGS
jgi:starch phosphorylase